MRYVLAAVIVATFPALAAGQRPHSPSPPPSIGIPLPPIGLPLPPIGIDTSRDQPSGVGKPAPPSPDRGRHFQQPAIVIFGAPYAFGVDPALQSTRPGMIAPGPAPAEAAPPPPAPIGILRLEVEPAHVAQVFVDGEFVGTPADVNGQLELEPGTHRIEIRARGYETLAFDARAVAGRTITYRETLARVRAAVEADKSAAGSRAGNATISPTSPTRPNTTFYLIPGCYLGNVHPDLVKLPEGCDFSRMITHTPQR